MTHDYETRPVKSADLDSTMVLVGECGGLSAVVGEVYPATGLDGLVAVETEHGTLYLDPDDPVDVLVA